MIRNTRFQWIRGATPLATLATALGLAACSDNPTGPAGESGLDTQAAESNLTTLDGFFDSSEWRSFEAFGGRVEDSGVRASFVPELEDIGDGSRTGRELATAAAMRLFAAASQTPLISAGSLGKTFAIDPETGEYAEDPARTGAPANGVRFVLYAPLGEDETPDLEREIGYVDLVDNGATAPGIDLRLTAVAEDVVFLDYGVALEGDDSAGSVQVDGFLRHEGDRLDFDFAAESSEVAGETTLSVDATLDVESRDFHVALDVDGVGSEDDGALTVELSVAFESHSIAISASGSDGEIDATFRVNGQIFATATGNSDDPVIVGADGGQLSLDEIRVLIDIIQVSEDILTFFGELLEPAGDIILLGLIL